jgi:formamidopyrimidine-DNA glycosylase
MPEIKEIRKFANFIEQKIKNEYIINIKILNGRYKTHGAFEKYLTLKKNLPLKVLDVKTKGKLIYMIFDKELFLLNTLGLNGGWSYLSNKKKYYEFSQNLEDYSEFISEDQIQSYINNSLNHLNVEFITKKGSLYFYDILSFGTIKILNSNLELDKKLNKIGNDIMDEETTFEIFKNQIIKFKNLDKAIGIVLVDQKIISGIGNYLRSDILYISKINPFRKVKNLNNKEIKKIYNNSKILTWGDYDKNEAKRLNIINQNTKLPSYYNRMFYIYNQETDMYGNKVIKKELYEGSQKRFIYYVKEIQI